MVIARLALVVWAFIRPSTVFMVTGSVAAEEEVAKAVQAGPVNVERTLYLGRSWNGWGAG